jgi:hypothetical protein
VVEEYLIDQHHMHEAKQEDWADARREARREAQDDG